MSTFETYTQTWSRRLHYKQSFWTILIMALMALFLSFCTLAHIFYGLEMIRWDENEPNEVSLCKYIELLK